MDRDQILTPRQVEGMIAKGDTIVIFQDMVLKLDGWLQKHPGGKLAILHMVGRDATDEIMAYHRAPTLKSVSAFRIGRKPLGPWINMKPPIRGGVYLECTDDEARAGGALDDSDTEGESLLSEPALTDISSGTSVFSSTDAGLRKRIGTPLSQCSSASVEGGDAGAMTRAEFTTSVCQADVAKDLLEYPPLDQDVQEDIVRRYRALHQAVIDEGLYQCNYWKYGEEMVRYTSLFVLFLVALRYEQYCLSAVFLGGFWHQIMFTAHDAGHRAITQKFVIDSAIGVFIADFCCGLSIGWWKSSHNVHHLITNHPEHDPDIQNLALFATSPQFFKSLVSSYYDGFVFYWDRLAEFLVPIQQYTYYPIMAIARFNLYVLSWLHVLSNKSSGLGGSKAWWIRPAEMAGMACYWFLFGYCLVWCSIPTWTSRILFVLISHIVLMPLHVQINLSHWGMSTAELGEGESFAQRQMRTTMDIDCPTWLDWFHGGLQFQVVHHLFPRVPRHNLRRVQTLLKEFAKDTNIPYSLMGFVDGNHKVLGRLGEVGEQVKLLVRCQKDMAEKGEMGLH
ncbi:fatty acid desaturase [Emericellopsis atlantica]|uniref:Delta 8-(E)-sphingolipid desaturase n=1 Tax=Emericellopsis atlantica TaxID=2614577 RepID=A0A9P7ZG32_9HYPO|nr:fatty acid desaturase [Emericellopsis atlantica]KAG9251182.1 fatty acid desaturase [Emericellopsis atlantica]